MRQDPDEHLRDLKLHIRNLGFLFFPCLSFEDVRHQELQTEVINLQWRSNLNRTFAQTKFLDCYIYIYIYIVQREAEPNVCSNISRLLYTYIYKLSNENLNQTFVQTTFLDCYIHIHIYI